MVTVAWPPTYTVALTINLILCFNYSKTRLFVMVYHQGYLQILTQKMLKLQDICWNVRLEVLTGKVLLLVNPYTTKEYKGCGGEVGCCVVLHYKNIFNFLEAEFLLDPLNEMHLFALDFVYL